MVELAASATPIERPVFAPATPDGGQAAPNEPPARSNRPRAIRELPADERPRERLAERGAAGLSAAELVALVWGSGSRGASALALAETALATNDGLGGLSRAGEAELRTLPGVGGARAAQLAAAFELGRRAAAAWPDGRWQIRTAHDVADRLMVPMGQLEREELRVLLLNARNAVIKSVTVYQGNVSASLVRVGELFRDAVRVNAPGVILVHNHPSGDPTPSPDDLHLTAEALAAGRLLDIDVLDHLVIGHAAFVSLRERGIAFDRRGDGRPASGGPARRAASADGRGDPAAYAPARDR